MTAGINDVPLPAFPPLRPHVIYFQLRYLKKKERFDIGVFDEDRMLE